MIKILYPRDFAVHAMEYTNNLQVALRPTTPKLDVGLGGWFGTNFSAPSIPVPITLWGLRTGYFCSLSALRPINVLSIERAILHVLTRTRFNGNVVVSIGRYSFDFAELSPPLISRLLQIILSTRGPKINFSWVSPLQELYFKRMDEKFMVKKGLRRSKTKSEARRRDDVIDESSPVTLENYLFSSSFASSGTAVELPHWEPSKSAWSIAAPNR